MTNITDWGLVTRTYEIPEQASTHIANGIFCKISRIETDSI